jgi:dUTP pyrophosphatase
LEKINVKIKKLHKDAVVPTYGTDGASGFDFYALEDVLIQAGCTALVKTGIAMAIPNGYEIQVRPRSGMSLKTSFRVANAPGTIDSDYRGECCIIGSNTSTSIDAGEILIKKGDRIAQGVLSKVPQANFQVVEDLDNTDRGSGGFGSTGKK